MTSEFPPQPGGIGNHAYQLAEQLYRQGYRLGVIADERSKHSQEEAVFDATLNFQVQRVRWQSPRIMMYLQRLRLLFKEARQADVIIASGKFTLWAVAFASLFFKRKYIAVIHGSEVNFKKPLLKISIEQSLKRLSNVIAVSQYTKGLIDHLNIVAEVIPNGYDAEKWDASIQANPNLAGYPKLITVGNVTERKGQLQVIKHLPHLLKTYPNIQYHCVGLPTETALFKNRAEALGVLQQVQFHGRLEDKALQAMLMAMDVFVMLSVETPTGDVEGFGMALIEANALGIPTIGSKGCGIEDAILNYKSGILVAHNDPFEFEKALQTILASKERFSQEAKQWAAAHTWDDRILRYIEIIEY